MTFDQIAALMIVLIVLAVLTFSDIGESDDWSDRL